MTEKHYAGFEQIAEADIEAKSVATLRTVPGRGGTYGENGLTAQGLKERFDALPKLAIARLHALLTYLDAYINDEGNGLESRLKAIGDKADDIAIALVAESTARDKAIADEAQARETAVSAEAQARDSAVKAESVARAAAIAALKNELLGGASDSYNTLKELEDALKNGDSEVAAILKAISAVEAALAGKVDASSVSASADNYTIAKRISGGRLAVGRAAADADAVPYKQMREELERYLADGGGIPPDILDSITKAIKTIDTLEAKVANLEAGIAPDAFIVDDTTAYVKSIPADVKPYAELQSVGGMTHKISKYGNNLLDTDFANNSDPEVSADGDTIYLNYTSYGWSVFFSDLFLGFVIGKQYILTASAYGGDLAPATLDTGGIPLDTPFTLTEAHLSASFYFQPGYADDGGAGQPCGGTFVVILREVIEELIDTPVTSLDILGKNLFDCANAGKQSGGAVIVSRSENEITLKCPHIASYISAQFELPEWLVGKSVTLSAKWTVSGETTAHARIKWMRTGESPKDIITINASGLSKTAVIPEKPSNATALVLGLHASYYPANSAVGDSVTYTDVQVEVGGTATTFSPYHKTTFAIPSAVQALEGYGWGINANVYNGVEWDENGKPVYVKRVERLVFNGSEAWIKADTVDTDKWRNYVQLEVVAPTTGTSDIPNIVCNHYTVRGTGSNWSCNTSIATNGGGLFVYDDAYSTKDVSLWKAHLAELYASGNPLTVYYELKEPIVTDISAYFTEDNLIPVEGGGTITAVNEGNLAAPTTICYQKRGT